MTIPEICRIVVNVYGKAHSPLVKKGAIRGGTRMLTAVLAGCGAMSAVWLETIQKIEGLKLVGLVDVDRDRAQKCAERFDLRDVVVGSSLKDVLVSAKPNVVFDVAVPQVRRELVTTAFEHGCDVLTEKPMASSLEDARALVVAARAQGRIHAVVQNRRYLANVRRIRRFLDLQVLGKPTSIHCDFFLAPHFGGFREKMDHVLLVDMAIHTFDAARYMANAAPKSVLLPGVGATKLLVSKRLVGCSAVQIGRRHCLQLSRQLVRRWFQNQLGKQLAHRLRARNLALGRV